MTKLPDIDIDVWDRAKVVALLSATPASLENGKPHSTGLYLNPIPKNPFTGAATIDYKTAESMGYFKIDILNMSFYQHIKDRHHLESLASREPMWELLEHQEFVENLIHLSNHYDLVNKLKPKNIEQLAAVLAIIRPAKRHLENESWETIFKEVWRKPQDDSYFFKKSHAFGYAMLVMCQMNYLCDQVTSF